MMLLLYVEDIKVHIATGNIFFADDMKDEQKKKEELQKKTLNKMDIIKSILPSVKFTWSNFYV